MQPDALIIAGTIITNLLLIAGFGLLVPRWLRRQDNHAAQEATRLREMLLDVLSEQEAVNLRQAQIGSSLTRVQDQIGKLATSESAQAALPPTLPAETTGTTRLSEQVARLQETLGSWIEQSVAGQQAAQHTHRLEEVQSWSNLLGLLATMQDNIASLNTAVAQPQAHIAADRLFQELDAEMENLRMLADEIAGLQWKIRRSVLERETSLAALRAQVQNTPKLGHRAA
jgi:chromosome segregation ATPase